MRKLLRDLGLRLALFLIHARWKYPPAWEYLQPFDGPVIEGLERHEVVFAKDQPEYSPLRALRSKTLEGRAMSRWTLTPEQRAAVAAGADVYLELLTFRRPLQPILMAVGNKPNREFFEETYALMR